MLPSEVEKKLEELPNKIWKLNNLAIEAHETYLKAEAEYENKINESYLKFVATEDKTVKELVALSENAHYQERLNVIVLKAKYDKAKNDADCAEKLLGALQSIVKLKVSEIKANI